MIRMAADSFVACDVCLLRLQSDTRVIGLVVYEQVWGTKRVTLYPPATATKLYPFPDPFLRNTSQVRRAGHYIILPMSM